MSDEATKSKTKKFLLTLVNSQGAVRHMVVPAADEKAALELGRDAAKENFAKTSLTEDVTAIDLAKFLADAEAAAKK